MNLFEAIGDVNDPQWDEERQKIVKKLTAAQERQREEDAARRRREEDRRTNVKAKEETAKANIITAKTKRGYFKLHKKQFKRNLEREAQSDIQTITPDESDISAGEKMLKNAIIGVRNVASAIGQAKRKKQKPEKRKEPQPEATSEIRATVKKGQGEDASSPTTQTQTQENPVPPTTSASSTPSPRSSSQVTSQRQAPTQPTNTPQQRRGRIGPGFGGFKGGPSGPTGPTGPKGSSFGGFKGKKKGPKFGGFKGGVTSTDESYEYSCWREEFMVELRDLRKKRREKNEDSPVDKMKGTNKISLYPKVSNENVSYGQLLEDMNGASIFAKATPPLKRRTTPMSDIHLSKQPGKGSAERVEKLMRKLFLGDRSGFYANYDLSGHKTDDNDIEGNRYSSQTNEAYDEDNETFRQHSRERFTAGSGDDEHQKRARRTARLLKRMAELNKDVVPPKKKKKKKKKEGQA